MYVVPMSLSICKFPVNCVKPIRHLLRHGARLRIIQQGAGRCGDEEPRLHVPLQQAVAVVIIIVTVALAARLHAADAGGAVGMMVLAAVARLARRSNGSGGFLPHVHTLVVYVCVCDIIYARTCVPATTDEAPPR